MEAEKIMTIVLFIIIIFIILFILNKVFKINFRNYLSGLNVLSYKQGMIGVEEEFTNLNPALITNKVSELDSVYLKNENNEHNWRNIIDEPLEPSNLYTPQGTPFSLTPSISNTELIEPSSNVGGDKEQSMFMFAQNKCSPGCCPSSFSCSTGCVCTTKQQRDFISTRGSNRTLTDNNEF